MAKSGALKGAASRAVANDAVSDALSTQRRVAPPVTAAAPRGGSDSTPSAQPPGTECKHVMALRPGEGDPATPEPDLGA